MNYNLGLEVGIMEEFKYAPSTLNTLVGALWIFVGVLNFGLFLFMIFSGVNTTGLVFSLVILLQMALSVFLGMFYLNLTKRNYVTIDESWGISVDKGLVWSSKDTCFDEIKLIKIFGNDIRIGLHSGDEVRIKTDCLTIDDIEKINQIVSEKIAE